MILELRKWVRRPRGVGSSELGKNGELEPHGVRYVFDGSFDLTWVVDCSGLDCSGLDCSGLGCSGLDWTGL